MNIYKTILLTLIEPVVEFDVKELRDYADKLRLSAMQNPGVEMGTYKMLIRVAKFIEMSEAIIRETRDS